MKKITISKSLWTTILYMCGIILIAFVFWALSGCKTCEPITIVKDSIRTEIKSVPVEIPVYYEDSTYALLWLQCNENNDVIIKQSEFYKGKYTDILSKLEAGKLTVRTKTIIKDSILYISRDTNTYNSSVRTVKINELTKAQKWWIRTGKWSFSIAIILLVMALVYTFFRFKESILTFFKK